jgi:site-specific DNA recombinase
LALELVHGADLRSFRQQLSQEIYLQIIRRDDENTRVTALPRDVTGADDKLKRLYRLIEDGMTEMDDVLKDRLNSLKADRDRTKAALERAKSHSSQAIQIDPALLEQFGRSMRENFTTLGDL